MSINKMICTSSLALLLLAGCSAEKTNEWFVTHNGNMPTNDRIEQINVGDSQEDVRRILGAPSSVVSFDKNTWIYMSSDVKRVAFFAPEEIDRDVLTVRFNESGQVSEVSRLNKENGESITVSSDETASYGQQPGFFRKYFGGVGRYAPFGTGSASQL